MRKPRRIVESGRYHVIARANRGEFILYHESIKELFLHTVERAKSKYDFVIENFCVMDNHVHFIIIPGPNSTLSQIMRWILGVFAMRFNRINGLKGHVWYDRFTSKVIDDIRQFLATFIYIARNPVKALLADRPVDYLYSGVRHISEGRFNILDPPNRLIRLLFPEWVQHALP